MIDQYRWIVFSTILGLFLCGRIVLCQKPDPDQIRKNHIASLGLGADRKLPSSLLAVGLVSSRTVSQRNLSADGRAVFASTATENFMGFALNAVDYGGERFVHDGKKTFVGFAQNGVRSVLGNFVESNDWILKESLFAGVISRSWALANGKGKLSGGGSKKLNGVEFFSFDYSPTKRSDVAVEMFFDKVTSSLRRIEYKRTSSAGIGARPEQSSQFYEARHKVIEEFSDYQSVHGATLPHTYTIRYTVSGSSTTDIEWTVKISKYTLDPKLDTKTFVIDSK